VKGVIMNIILKGGYVLESDTNQIILKKLTGTNNKAGNPNKTVVGYHSTIASALNGYVKNSILESEATEIKELLKEVKDLDNYIKEMLGGR